MRIIGNDPSTPRQAQIVASGTLPSGKPVVVNSDGTVSVAAETSFTEAVGSPTVFETSTTLAVSSAYDSVNQKVVIVYTVDSSGSYPAYAIVGTVSDTSISFGTAVSFSSSTQNSIGVCFDTASGKVVVVFRDHNSNRYGAARVGTISGTSISFGTKVVFHSNDTTSTVPVYDAANEKTVVLYNDNNNVDEEAIVGTVSGTSISFGSPVVFEGNSTQGTKGIYDSVNGKIIVVYQDALDGNSFAIVGTVSGTSISFGSRTQYKPGRFNQMNLAFDPVQGKAVVVYQYGNIGQAVVLTVSGTSISAGSSVDFASNVANGPGATYDPLVGKIVVCYSDASSSSQGTYKLGTISGTSISFGSGTVFESGSTSSLGGVIYGAGDERVTIPYSDGGNSSYGTAVVLRNAYTSINLTADNYIGTAATGAPDGTGAKINLKGAVDENQSGLTAGQSYYVQTDGTLGTTPADPSVFAGTAVAATKLIVKG